MGLVLISAFSSFFLKMSFFHVQTHLPRLLSLEVLYETETPPVAPSSNLFSLSVTSSWFPPSKPTLFMLSIENSGSFFSRTNWAHLP